MVEADRVVNVLETNGIENVSVEHIHLAGVGAAWLGGIYAIVANQAAAEELVLIEPSVEGVGAMLENIDIYAIFGVDYLEVNLAVLRAGIAVSIDALGHKR